MPNRHTLNHRRSQHLLATFKAAGRRQPEVFANLSRHVERLVAETKDRNGEKSGAMQRAFGDDLVRQKGRYCAKDGTPPGTLCKTPGNWIRVLRGFAVELGRDEHALLSEILEDCMAAPRPVTGFGQDAWLADLDDLLEPMVERLASEANLPAILDDIARSGLWLEDGKIVVSEWPRDPGIEPAGLYNPEIVGLIPHVWGLNYSPITAPSFDMAEVPDGTPLWEMLKANGFAPADLENVATIDAVEATRTGIAFAVRSDTGEPELAFMEWQIAFLLLKGADGSVLSRHLANSGYPLPATMSGSVMAMTEPTDEDFRTRPVHWNPNSLRLHFRGTSGFDRMAASLIVKPWIWSDPDELDFLYATDPDELALYPLACPPHTVAGAIESNLRYADELGHPGQRLDRLLASEIHRVRDLVTQYRQAGEPRRQATREALLADWKAITERNRSSSKESN